MRSVRSAEVSTSSPSRNTLCSSGVNSLRRHAYPVAKYTHVPGGYGARLCYGGVPLHESDTARILDSMNPVRDHERTAQYLREVDIISPHHIGIASHGAGSRPISDGMKKRVGAALILILAFCGFADSVYLMQHAFDGVPLLCDIQNLSGCNVVAASHYSYIFGIPVAELGVLFYGTIFVAAALEIILSDQFLRRVLQGGALIGGLFSLYSVSVQVFVLGAFCIYCLTSASIAFLIFILASCIEPVRRLARQLPPAPPPAAEPSQRSTHFSMPPA